MIDKSKLRVCDTVLVRGHVTTDGRIAFADGEFEPIAAGKLDIVSVEQAFRIGDRVKIESYVPHDLGEIVALSSGEVDPPQAWVKISGTWSMTTFRLKDLRRLDP
jgi:hypothetical protein